MQNSALKKIESHILRLDKYNFNFTSIEKKQYCYETTVIKNNQKIKLLVYFGKKGLKTVIQGNTSSEIYNEINGVITGNISFEFNKHEEPIFEEYIGTDETGKGDFFGPLVVAGFYVDRKSEVFLKDLNVRDSKELKDPQIDFIANKIKTEFPKNFSIISISPQKYNELYEEFKNLNKLLNWAHSKVIENLLQNISTNTVIIDQFSKNPLNISLKKEYAKINFIQMPKAEKYIGVAAASILARNKMNYWFNKKRNEGFNVLKGASLEVENEARKILNGGSKENIGEFVKLHFKTMKKIFEN